MRPFKLVSVLVLLCAVVTAAFGADEEKRMSVLVLTNPSPNFEGNIYKYPLNKIGADYTVYTTEQIDEAVSHLADFDLVLLGLWADANLLMPHLETVRNWVKAGGGFCVFDACDGRFYSSFCKALASEGEKDAAIDACGCEGSRNSTKYGFVLDPDPIHPLRSFPRRVRYECRQWHCLKAGAVWKTVATCSGPYEKHPVVSVRPLGRGFVYVSSMQQRWSSVAANLRTYLNCRRLGLEPLAYEAPLARPGKERLTVRFSAFDGVKQVSATLTIADAKGAEQKQTKVFKAGAGKPGEIVVSLPVSFKARGENRLRLSLKTALGERTVMDEKFIVPEAASVSGPLYRNRLSASRRTDAVSVKVEAYPDAGRTRTDSASVKIVDPKGAVVAKAKASFPEDLKSNEVIVKVPLPAATPLEVSDGWRIEAAVSSGGKTYTAESKMTVVGTDHPGEVTIDEDMTLIMDGKPFFPLVLYNIVPECYQVAVDMGFNAIHTFQWFSRQNESFKAAEALGLKVFFENNEKEPGGFYHMPAKYRDEKSMLFWYLPDEPLHEVNTDFAGTVAKILMNDPYHPLVMVDCWSPRFEANGAHGDILAPDCYVVDAKLPTEQQPYLRIIDSMDVAKRAVNGRKSVMHVLDAFGHENETDYMMTAFLSIARDARGLMWYGYDQQRGDSGVRHHEESRAALAATVEKVKAVVPYLVNPVRRPFETETKDGGKIYGIVCGTADCAMIVVNPTAQTAAMPTVPEMGRAKTTDLFGDPDQDAAGKIAPFSVRVLTWKGAGSKLSVRKRSR